MDTIYHINTGFELPDRCRYNGNLSSDKAFKGEHASYSDPENMYGYTYIDSLKNFPKRKHLFGSLYFYTTNADTKAGMVVKIEKGDSLLSHFEFGCGRPDGKDKWKLITFYVDLKDAPKDAIIKIFMFSHDEGAWMDDLNLYFADEFF